MSLQCGIVGLPNVGKSTLFNALTKAGVAAENYPFCTIEPSVGIVEVPDNRGKGIFYWEPAWLPTHGATWATKAGMKYNNDDWKEGNARENQSLFDCEGHVLQSMKVFN